MPWVYPFSISPTSSEGSFEIWKTIKWKSILLAFVMGKSYPPHMEIINQPSNKC
jgi:hypothetical protein